VTQGNSGDELEKKIRQYLADLRIREPAFTEKLGKLAADLTQYEFVICGLKRDGMLNREIKNFFGTSERTVEKHDEHIRVKLKLLEGQNLKAFLMML
jgi:DNA-binding NarL/FixJ family response regulator